MPPLLSAQGVFLMTLTFFTSFAIFYWGTM